MSEAVYLCVRQTAVARERNTAFHLDPAFHGVLKSLCEPITTLFCFGPFSLGFYHLEPKALTNTVLKFKKGCMSLRRTENE